MNKQFCISSASGELANYYITWTPVYKEKVGRVKTDPPAHQQELEEENVVAACDLVISTVARSRQDSYVHPI